MDGILKIISPTCFAYSQIESIDIPNSVINISRYAGPNIEGGPFTSCLKLKAINIAEDSQLQYLGWSFAQTTNITTFYIPKDCKIDKGAFNLMEKLTSFTIHPENPYYKLYNGLLYSYDYTQLYQCPCAYPDVVKIHPECKQILFYCFRGYTSKYDLVIPENVTTFETNSLMHVNCPTLIFQSLVTEIGSGNFIYSFYNIYLPKTLNKLKSSNIGDFRGKYIEFYSKIQILESGCITNCYNLEYVKFHDVDQNLIIKSNAFNNCPKLKHIILPVTSSSLISFEPEVFIECPLMRKIKYIWHLSSVSSHFLNGRKNNISDLTIFSFDNSTCGEIDISVNSADQCKVYKKCSMSYLAPALNKFVVMVFILL